MNRIPIGNLVYVDKQGNFKLCKTRFHLGGKKDANFFSSLKESGDRLLCSDFLQFREDFWGNSHNFDLLGDLFHGSESIVGDQLFRDRK